MESIVEVLYSIARKIAHRVWRELAILTALYVIWSNLKASLGGTPATLLILASLAAIFSIRPVRVRVIDFWRIQRQRYLYARAFSLSPTLAEFPPVIIRIERGEHSTTVIARLQHGTTVEDLEKIREPLAVTLHLGSVRVVRDNTDASLVSLVFVRGAPLTGKVLAWPGDLSRETSMWDRLPLGLDEEGTQTSIFLPEHSLLVAGEPGSGKTRFLALLLMFIITCPSVKLYIFDPKEVDLVDYEPFCERFIGGDIDAAVEVLQHLRELMNERYKQLRDLHLKKVTPDCGLGHIVVVIDELHFYIAAGKQGKEFAEGLRDLVARARAAGIILILATQKPSSDTIPTSIRDNVSLRVAFRCGSLDASATILGQGWAGEGYNAATIPLADRGVAYLLADAGIPQLFRSYYVDESQQTSAIEAACELRELKEGDV